MSEKGTCSPVKRMVDLERATTFNHIAFEKGVATGIDVEDLGVIAAAIAH
jgi:hypothetical protein